MGYWILDRWSEDPITKNLKITFSLVLKSLQIGAERPWLSWTVF